MTAPARSGARAVRAQPHGAAARRQRAHGALQLAAGAPHGRHVRPAHRGHRLRAIDARVGGRHPRRPAVAGARRGTKASRRAATTARTASRSGCTSIARTPWSCCRAAPAYHCFCTAEELEADRQRALAAGLPPKYTGRCRAVTRDAARRRIEDGEKAVIRFRVPDDRDVVFEDVVRGEVRFSTSVIGDPVLVRSDGVPAYNFAVVIDDALMGITHVVRGEDHISNTPRQVLLYEAFGWTPPTLRARLAGDGARTTRRCRSATAPRRWPSSAPAAICRRR